MKKLILLTAFCFFFALASPAFSQPGSPVYLVQQSQPKASIVLPTDSPDAVTLAARELQTYVKKISGAQLPIVPQAPANGYAIVFKTLPDNPADLNVHDTFVLDSGQNRLAISGHSDVAVLYGAYQFLNNLGVFWYSPGEIGESVPVQSDIKIGLGSKTYRPEMRSRVIDYSGTNDLHFGKENQAEQHKDYDLWLLRNKLQFYRTLHKEKNNDYHEYDFGWVREFSNHNIRHAALKPIDGAVAIERYPLVTFEGTPQRAVNKLGRGTQICFTHPQNIESAIQSAVEYFTENPRYITYSLSLQDSHGLCDCANCVQANKGVLPSKNPNRVVWKFMNAVAKSLGQKMPGKRIAFYAIYAGMTRPPVEIKAEPNIVAVTCHVTSQAREIEDPDDPYNVPYLDNMRLVKASGAELGSYDYFMYAGNPQPLTVLSDVQTYHKLGYQWLAVEWMGRDEQRYAVAWVMAQMAWNGRQEPRQLLETYCRKYYGAAGEKVLSLLDLVESRVRSMKRITLGSFTTTSTMLTPEVVEQGRVILREAAPLAKGRELERVRRLGLNLELWSQVGELDRKYRIALDLRTPESKKKVLDSVAAFKQFWKEKNFDQLFSPGILPRFVDGYITNINAMTTEVKPVAAKNSTGASRAQLIAAMFSGAEAELTDLLRVKKGQEDGITLLPELWKFKVDPADAGASSSITYGKKAPPWGKFDYKDDKWSQISTYNHFDKQGFPNYSGVFWYRLTFVAPNYAPGEDIWLRFGSLDDDGAVYVNGVLVLDREGVRGHAWDTSFACNVTKRIKSGQPNVIAVRGLNWVGAGGLWKPVGLYTLPQS